MSQDDQRDARARHLLSEILQAITCIEPVERIDALLANAMAELRDPVTFGEFRIAAEIARLGLVFVHDRGDAATSGAATPYLDWTCRLVEDPQTPLSDDFMLLAEAIDSGKRNEASRVIAVAGRALNDERLDRTLRLLDGGADAHPEAKHLAGVQLRLVSELGRALRLSDPLPPPFLGCDRLVAILDALERHPETPRGFAMYRARLAVAYVARDIAGDLPAASGLLQRALDNREHDRRTELTVPLHEASRLRLEAVVHRGRQHVEIARPVDEQARAMEDECLSTLTSLGFHRHVASFELFRKRFGD